MASVHHCVLQVSTGALTKQTEAMFYNPSGIVLSHEQRIVLTNLEYVIAKDTYWYIVHHCTERVEGPMTREAARRWSP